MDFSPESENSHYSQNSCPDILLLMDLALGKHPPGVKQHTRRCAACRGKLKLYRDTLKTPELEYERRIL